MLYNVGREYEAASVELHAAAKLRPDAETFTALAQVLLKLKKDREAIAALRGALAFAPRSTKEAGTLSQ